MTSRIIYSRPTKMPDGTTKLYPDMNKYDFTYGLERLSIVMVMEQIILLVIMNVNFMQILIVLETTLAPKDKYDPLLFIVMVYI